MRTELETRWSVSWQYVDRRQLFDAVRVRDDWRDAVINSMQPMDDHDPDTMSASVEVSTLEELRDLLVATAGVTTPWGVALCVNGKADQTSVYANLASAQGDCCNAPLTLLQKPPAKGENPALDTLVEAQKLIRKAMEELH